MRGHVQSRRAPPNDTATFSGGPTSPNPGTNTYVGAVRRVNQKEVIDANLPWFRADYYLTVVGYKPSAGEMVLAGQNWCMDCDKADRVTLLSQPFSMYYVVRVETIAKPGIPAYYRALICTIPY